jgi:hypothetical protein
MPRDMPSWGDSALEGARAGDLTREGSGEGERALVEVADRGLGTGVSAVSLP